MRTFHPSYTAHRMPAARSAWRARLDDWWHSLPPATRSRAWPASLAVLTILALLLGFHQVVRTAVQQGEILRMSAASRAEAVHQCNLIRAPRVRASCLQHIDEAPPAAPDEPAPANTAALSVAQAGR